MRQARTRRSTLLPFHLGYCWNLISPIWKSLNDRIVYSQFKIYQPDEHDLMYFFNRGLSLVLLCQKLTVSNSRGQSTAFLQKVQSARIEAKQSTDTDTDTDTDTEAVFGLKVRGSKTWRRFLCPDSESHDRDQNRKFRDETRFQRRRIAALPHPAIFLFRRLIKTNNLDNR